MRSLQQVFPLVSCPLGLRLLLHECCCWCVQGKVKEVVGDDGIVVMPNKVNVICPITRKLIVKPVKKFVMFLYIIFVV